MKKTEPEKALYADPELDAELALMAEEVPPMPADFHEKWMGAVRADARKKDPVAEYKEEKAPVSLARWTRILSAAAVFVFLIGGTILFRNSRKTLTGAGYRTESTEAAVFAADTDGYAVLPDAGNGEVSEAINAEKPIMLAAEAAEKNAGKTELLYAVKAGEGSPAKAAEDAGETAGAASKARKEVPPMVAGAMMDAAVEEASVMEGDAAAADYKAAEDYAAAYEAAAAEYDMAEEETGDYETEEVPAQVESTPDPTARPTESIPESKPEESEGENGFLEQVGSFFTDMGDFLLAALPYLAVLAVPAAAALIIRRKKK